MTRNAEGYRQLIQDLTVARAQVGAQVDDHRKMIERARCEFAEADGMAWAAVAYTVHNVYNALENYFLRIAKFFDNHLEGATWHADLVNRMAVEVPGVRPAVLDTEDLAPFHELRAFRHVFRGLYDRALDPRRVAVAAEYIEPCVRALDLAHERFLAQLTQIRDALREPGE